MTWEVMIKMIRIENDSRGRAIWSCHVRWRHFGVRLTKTYDVTIKKNIVRLSKTYDVPIKKYRKSHTKN